MLRALLGCLVVLAAAGCVDVHTVFTLREDSSGFFEAAYTVSEEVVNQFRAMYKVKAELARATGRTEPAPLDPAVPFLLEPNEDRIRSELKRYEANGIAIDTLKVDVLNNKRRVQMKLRFRSLSELAKADFFPEYGFSLKRTTEGNYHLFREGYEVESDSVTDLSDPATTTMLAPFLSGFRVAIKVVTPGAIMESNASRPSQFAATWLYDYERDPNALLLLQATDMKILFEGEGLRLPQITRRPGPAAKTE
jgi:hypothetical protein